MIPNWAPTPAFYNEWLATNGSGAYACGSVAGAVTRRYHAFLCAAIDGPQDRRVLVTKLEETLVCDGQNYPLSANFWPGSISPRGDQYLDDFALDPLPRWTYRVPTSQGEVTLEKTLWMVPDANTSVARYEIVDGPGCELRIRPFLAPRSYHGTQHANADFNQHIEVSDGGDALQMRPYPSQPPIFLASAGRFCADENWYLNFCWPIEAERGLDAREDAFCPGYFCLDLEIGAPQALCASTETVDLAAAVAARESVIQSKRELIAAPDKVIFAASVTIPGAQEVIAGAEAMVVDAAKTMLDAPEIIAGASKMVIDAAKTSIDAPEIVVDAAKKMIDAPGMIINAAKDIIGAPEIIIGASATALLPTALLPTALLPTATFSAQATGDSGPASENAPDWGAPAARLKLAADQFIVKRADGLHTVLAGYPWFTDWGRDTMISLPGLCLTTGRFDIAASILRSFAGAMSQGMIPNRFPEANETPDYNTVDATLWFFHAVFQYGEISGDWETVRELYPRLVESIEWHLAGTRYGIMADDDDGLLRAGDASTQLTWMDAKIGDTAFTPRAGKPVEIQALWFNALCDMADAGRRFDDQNTAGICTEWSRKIASNFADTFWNAGADCLYDCVDGESKDGAIRPNQIFAVSLPHRLLSHEQEHSVVSVVESELLTPVGLRSLSPLDSRYRGHYGGDQWSRDSAYHQGTVWGWLLGPFVMAHLRVHENSPEAKTRAQGWLAPMIAQLDEAGLGSISEIFDGDAPHAPRGCFAQAWSVAETLRAWQAAQ